MKSFFIILLFLATNVFAEQRVTIKSINDNVIVSEIIIQTNGKTLVIKPNAENEFIATLTEKEVYTKLSVYFTIEGKQHNQKVWISDQTKQLHIKKDEDKYVIEGDKNSIKASKKIEHINKKLKSYTRKGKNKKLKTYIKRLISDYPSTSMYEMLIEQYLNSLVNDKKALNDLLSMIQSENLIDKNTRSYKMLDFFSQDHYVSLKDVSFVNQQKDSIQVDFEFENFLILDFWAVGCVGCVKDHKIIKKEGHYQKLKEKGVELIGVNLDGNTDRWIQYEQSHDYDWPSYEFVVSEAQKLGSWLSLGVPTYLLVDKEGKVIGNYRSFEDVFNYIEEKLM